VPPAKFHVPVSFGSMILLLPYSNFAGAKIVTLKVLITKCIVDNGIAKE
jgi:hypothetical protein